ncbi:MAG TPA: hypothetical protein VKI44_29055 [Acetobacteraceae bacterium]|nr:hypothetical protein [Acetobacteraceae bacterium]
MLESGHQRPDQVLVEGARHFRVRDRVRYGLGDTHCSRVQLQQPLPVTGSKLQDLAEGGRGDLFVREDPAVVAQRVGRQADRASGTGGGRSLVKALSSAVKYRVSQLQPDAVADQGRRTVGRKDDGDGPHWQLDECQARRGLVRVQKVQVGQLDPGEANAEAVRNRGQQVDVSRQGCFVFIDIRKDRGATAEHPVPFRVQKIRIARCHPALSSYVDAQMPD